MREIMIAVLLIITCRSRSDPLVMALSRSHELLFFSLKRDHMNLTLCIYR
jgi:hypothetical protein